MAAKMILSGGGMDTLVLAAMLAQDSQDAYNVLYHVGYGQPAVHREWAATEAIGRKYNIRAHHVEIFPRIQADTMFHMDMYFPNRNMILVSRAVAWCLGTVYPRGGDQVVSEVWIGAQSEGSLCPDVQPAFVNFLERAVDTATLGKVKLVAPLVYWHKHDILEEGTLLKVDWDISWSCFLGGYEPCGKCAGCIRREEVFSQ